VGMSMIVKKRKKKKTDGTMANLTPNIRGSSGEQLKHYVISLDPSVSRDLPCIVGVFLFQKALW